MDNQTSYSLSPQPAGNKNKTMMIVIVVILLAAAVGGFFFWQQQSKKPEETKMAVKEKESPTTTPSPTKKPIDRSKIKIQVLNGTGTPGEAGKAVEALVKAGYDKDYITTGNAEEYDHAEATIQVKDGKDDLAKDVEKSLSDTFEDISVDSTDLDEDSDYDVVVTTGGEIFEEPTGQPTTKPTTSATTTTPSPTSGTLTTTPTRSPTPTPQ